MRVTELLPPDDCRINEALSLALRVFDDVEAQIYPPSGREHFAAFVTGDELKKHIASGDMKIYICSENCTVIGMMAVQNKSHISLAFVGGEHRCKGVGRELFERICEDLPESSFTVNAAPPAEMFYRKLGFIPTDMEHFEDGIIYIPMIRKP